MTDRNDFENNNSFCETDRLPDRAHEQEGALVQPEAVDRAADAAREQAASAQEAFRQAAEDAAPLLEDAPRQDGQPEPIEHMDYIEADEPAREAQQATFGSGEWQRVEPEEIPTPKKKRRTGKVLLSVLAVLLAAGLCFGAGYGGVLMASATKNKVVLQQIVSTPSEGEADPTRMPAQSADALTSEQVADKVRDSVVAITTEQMTTGSYWYGSYVISGAGSGIIISEDGYILTCAHVINDATKITVELSSGATYDAELVGSYVNGDIAVVKINASGLSPAEIADSNAVKQGAVCYAVGNPQGRFSGSISDGIVSALNRTITVQVESTRSNNGRGNSLYDMFYGNIANTSSITLNVIQMTAAVSPGNSGGALFNDQGQLIGVVSAKSSDSDSEGLGFAVPINKGMEIATQLIANGVYEGEEEQTPDSNVIQTSNKAILGIKVQTVTEQDAARYNLRAGVYVTEITQDSTRKAGLQVGDRIISADDVLVNEAVDVTQYLADKNVGDVVTLHVERAGRMVSVPVTLVANPNAE